MKTTIEVTLKIDLVHNKETPCLDENSVKAAINKAIKSLTDVGLYDFYNGKIDRAAEDVNVKIVKLKENGKRQALSLYGTDDVSWFEA